MGSSSLQVSTDSFNGINFGKKICLENGSNSSKVDNPMKNPPRCQVEGCSVDLSGEKAYYGKHKVCGMHSKSPMVVVGGLEQRFCQQCSRFHLLPEFDQGKRSCRRRLAGHNERRRKPPASLSSRIGLSSSPFCVDDGGSRLGGFLVNFACPQLSVGDRAIVKQWQGGIHVSVPEISSFDSSHAFSLLSSRAFVGTATNSTSVSPDKSFDAWGFDTNKVVEPTWMQNELKSDLQRERRRLELRDEGSGSLL